MMLAFPILALALAGPVKREYESETDIEYEWLGYIDHSETTTAVSTTTSKLKPKPKIVAKSSNCPKECLQKCKFKIGKFNTIL